MRRLRGREIITALKRAGFVVACHAGETIGPGLMRKILRDVEMDPEQFERFL